MSHFPDNNPYESPYGSDAVASGLTPSGREAAQRKLFLPALFLMILAPLSIPLAGFDFFGRMIAKPEDIPFVDQNNRQAVEQAKTFSNIFAGIDILLITSQFVLFAGAFYMMKVKSKSLAMMAAIMACVPCISPICCLGIPFGVWALVVMNDPLVQKAFES